MSEDLDYKEVISLLKEDLLTFEDTRITLLFRDEAFIENILCKLDILLLELNKLTQRIDLLESNLNTDPRVATWLRSTKDNELK